MERGFIRCAATRCQPSAVHQVQPAGSNKARTTCRLMERLSYRSFDRASFLHYLAWLTPIAQNVQRPFEVSVASNGHRLLVAGIALVSAFQYHFQGCRLQSRAKPRLPPRRKAGREVRAPAPGVLRYNRAVLQLKFVWIVK